MTKPHSSHSQANHYFKMLAHLDKESRLDLISQLSLSLMETENPLDKEEKDEKVRALCGAWDSEESAEELIESIQSSRASNRQIEPLD